MRTLEDVLTGITPAPDPGFVADMESRMRRGFPRKRPRTLAFLSPRPVAAVAATAMLAGLIAVSLSGGEHNPSVPQAVTEIAAPAAQDRVMAVPPSVAGGGVAAGASIRRVERSAQLALAANPDEFDRIADAIFRITDQRRGFVLQSTLTQDQDEGGSNGSFELRVPVDELQPALNDLSRLATVRARSESGTDVTGSFLSTRQRLQTARALRTSLLRRLELATTDTAESAIRRRLEIVGNRLASLRTQMRDVRRRTELATVFVELVDQDAGAVAGETDQAVDDAVGSLEDILNFLIRAVGILVPLALAAAVAWFALVRSRRRARDRALA